MPIFQVSMNATRLGKRCPSVGPWGFDIYMTKEASTLLGHWFVET